MTPSELSEHLATLDLEERLRWISAQNPQTAAVSTSFGKEDQALTDAIARHSLPIRIFTLDTGRLFEETQAIAAITRERYGITIETFFPDATALQELVTAKGPTSFYESVEARLECCRIRKVEPLSRALRNASLWITGLRRGQSPNRALLPFAQWDEDHHLLKVHPLLDWEDERLEAYLKEHNVPVNRLHARGFPSIGCAPCTRAVAPGQDARAGRWWWEDATKRECGLHLPAGETA